MRSSAAVGSDTWNVPATEDKLSLRPSNDDINTMQGFSSPDPPPASKEEPPPVLTTAVLLATLVMIVVVAAADDCCRGRAVATGIGAVAGCGCSEPWNRRPSSAILGSAQPPPPPALPSADWGVRICSCSRPASVGSGGLSTRASCVRASSNAFHDCASSKTLLRLTPSAGTTRDRTSVSRLKYNVWSPQVYRVHVDSSFSSPAAAASAGPGGWTCCLAAISGSAMMLAWC